MRTDLAKEDNSSMLRDPSLVQLSRQHQHALALCVRIERALRECAADLGAWKLEMHQLYTDEIQFHFAAEEEVLFPSARRFPELAALVEELSGEHESLRHYFGRAEKGTINQAEPWNIREVAFRAHPQGRAATIRGHPEADAARRISIARR
jgi:hypothetical protein